MGYGMSKTSYKIIGFLLFVSFLFNFYLLYEIHQNKRYFEVQKGHFVSIDILNEIYITCLQLDEFSQLYIRTEDIEQLKNYNNIANQVFGKIPRTNTNLYHMKIKNLLDIITENLSESQYEDVFIKMFEQLELQHEYQKKAFQTLLIDKASRCEAVRVLSSSIYLDSINSILTEYTKIFSKTKHSEPTFDPIDFTFI